jgi:ABC-type cobalamin/Fe3+-siderophores transport system ATPase subunit
LKIDIHTHTKKCKSGDAPTREVTAEVFCNTVLSTDVKVIAVTNHNVFDLQQFQAIQERIGKDAVVWPGVELDVYDDNGKGHLLVITSPTRAVKLAAAVAALTRGHTPDTFKVTIPDVLKTFDAMEPLYVAHYKQKQPSVSDDMLVVLEAGAKNKWCVLKEVSNAISAGIHISHGRSSIYGSDVHDWGAYAARAHELPELRLPIDSFEHFCLLLKKDPTAINTVLDRKTSEDLSLAPFGDGTTLSIKAFNDINVIFGPKGTGKSCILKAIAKHYSKSGIDATVYESASGQIDEIFDVKGKTLSVNLNAFDISYCQDEIQTLRDACEVDVTSIQKYVGHFNAANTNKNAQKIRLKEIDPEEEGDAKRGFNEYNKAAATTEEFFKFLKVDPAVKKEILPDELKELNRILSLLLERLGGKKWTAFGGWKEIVLLNSAIKSFRKEIQRNTGSPAKPTTTGFRDYALNRIKIGINARNVLRAVVTKIPPQEEDVGDLGSGKGRLKFVTELVLQNGNVTDGEMLSLNGVKKLAQKKFMSCVRDVIKHAFQDDLFHYVSELNSVEDAEGIKTVFELLLFKRYFTLDDLPYIPSNGESAMVMLQKELGTDKDVYILDEPEKSLGNEYISEVIVPLLNERARAGKRVFISTHDANIAVRTLPYCSIYRCYGQGGYSTYMGNPFTNNLVNIAKPDDLLDWKAVSMRTLEGGEEAFGERGRIYGNT